MAKTRKTTSRDRPIHRQGSRMPLFFVLGGVALLVIVAIFALQQNTTPYTPEVTGKANLTADKDKIDLGNVKLGNPVEVSFELKNTGDQPVRFTEAPYVEVKEGC